VEKVVCRMARCGQGFPIKEEEDFVLET